MISRKVLNKTTQILAVLLVLVFIGLTVYQRHLLKQAARNDGSQVATDAGTIDADIAEQARQEDLKQQRIELQRQLAEDPAFREAIRSSIEIQYAGLFQVLGLTPEKQDKLGTLLENSAVDYVVLNPDIFTAVSEAEKAAVKRRYNYLKKETELKVEALLGNDDYQTYKAYEERAVSRGVVEGFEKKLAAADSLSDSQARELIEIVYGESQAVYTEIGYDPTENVTFPSEMDAASIVKRVEILDRILDNSAEKSKDVLSVSQMEQYREYLRDYSEAQEMSLFNMYQQFGE